MKWLWVYSNTFPLPLNQRYNITKVFIVSLRYIYIYMLYIFNNTNSHILCAVLTTKSSSTKY